MAFAFAEPIRFLPKTKMMQQTARLAGGSLSRAVAIGFGALLIMVFAFSIASGKTTIAYLTMGLAVTPILLYVAARWPIVFPFGLYALTVPFDPLLKAANGAGGTLTKVVGIATIAALLFHAYRLRRLYAPPKSWYFWTAYMLWALLGWTWSPYPDDVAATLQIVGSLFALYTVAACYPISPRDYVMARRAIVVAGLFTALYGLYAYAAGQRLGTARLALVSGDFQIDPNHYAAFFALPIGLLAARLYCTRDVRERLLLGAFLIPMFLNVLLTGSRGGLVAAVVILVYLGFRARRYGMLGITIAAGTIMSFALPNVWARVFDSSQGDASGRAEIWNVGLTAAKHTGFFGSGFGTFIDVYDDNLHNAVQRLFAGFHRPAHSILIETLVDLGVPGLVLLFAAWYNTSRQNAWVPRSSPYFPDAIGYEAGIIGIFISALTIDLIWFKYPWLAFMMAAMLANVVRPRLLAGRPPVVRRQTARPPAAVREHVRL